MNIDLFNFLDDNAGEIVSRTEARVRRSRRGTGAPALAPSFTALLTRLYAGYLDLIVTGKSAVIDRMSGALIRVLPLHGLRFSDVFAIPLAMASAIRELLLERQESESVSRDKLNRAIETVESEAYRAAGRILDLLQSHLDTRVAEHNAYLRALSEQLKTEIAPLQIGRPAY